MIEFLAQRVYTGKLDIKEVPASLRDQVKTRVAGMKQDALQTQNVPDTNIPSE